MATLLTDGIKRSLAELALALGDPMAQRMALERDLYWLCDPTHIPPYRRNCQDFCAYVNISYRALAFNSEFYGALKDQFLTEDDKKQLDNVEQDAFDDLARHILTPSYALIAADTIRHYEGPDSGEYGFYWDLTAEQKILSDVVRGILVRLDGAIKHHLEAQSGSNGDERNGHSNETVDINELYARIDSLGDCVRDGILHTYSSYEFWQYIARDILKNNAPKAYEQVLEDERTAPAAKNKSGSKKK